MSSRPLAVYVRASTVEQSISLDEQQRACCAYVRARGRDVAGVFVDEGVSGSIPFGQRPAGALVLAACDSGAAGGIVAVRLDRLFRSATDCLSAVTRWTRSGVALHLVELGGQPVDTSSATGRLFVSMLAAFAEFERNLISDRTRGALAELKAQQRRVGTIPYGYRCNAGALVEDAQESAVIDKAQTWRRGGWTWEQIAQQLNDSGTPRRNGQPWHRKAVARCTKEKALAR